MARRYVHSEEVNFKDRLPEDGQEILFRLSGHRSYIRGTWNGKTKEVTYGESRTEVKWLGGWLPHLGGK